MARLTLVTALAATCALVAPTLAADPVVNLPVSARNSFRLGDAGVLCTAQAKPTDDRLKAMFDRAYLITCRDATSPVGSLLAVRRDVAMANEPGILATLKLDCKPQDASVDGIGQVEAIKCHDNGAGLDYLRYKTVRGKTTYFVEGLAGYDPALRLALSSVVLDKAQKGVVQVATTEVSDPAAFARIQAGSLDIGAARDEAYQRSNGFRFAESAEFFEDLATREENSAAALAEAYANQGLQQSNLGNFGAAVRLMNKAEEKAPSGDGVMQRLLRNYRAVNQLNQRDGKQALQELDRKVASMGDDPMHSAIQSGVISVPLADLINRESLSNRELTEIGAALTPSEKAAILDAQADALAGTALRLTGRFGEASTRLDRALKGLAAVRGGKVRSTASLASEVQVEKALVAEAAGDTGTAVAAFDQAISDIEMRFPSSPAMLSAKARKAGYLSRHGDMAGARALFADVVKESADVADSGSALRGLMKPYFEILAKDGSAGAAGEMFAASQILQRPGVAQTQAVLARQMSAGNDEASALFRLAVARTREIVRTEAEINRLGALSAPTPVQANALKAAQDSLEVMRKEQTQLQSKLADFPRYKALQPTSVDLAELQGALRPGEAYYKMMMVDGTSFALFANKGGARALQLGMDPAAMGREVSAIRDSIVKEDAGGLVTSPFDIGKARGLYLALFGPVDADVRAARHLIVEPDGPMLELPPYVLPASQPSVDAYTAKVAKGGDAYDMTGIDWLGRGREISISVSPRSFLDVRAIAPSRAKEAYLGLGHNAPATSRPVAAVADDCDWPIQTWQAPISDAELKVGQQLFGANRSELLTGAAFTDTALLGDRNLDDYRIVHFATHGLVTAPRPECPARPALVTSFAPDGSDGLLTFKEIFDLKLDADVVILSACDTAGRATLGATREAGIATGGNYALDGLVRAFVGAGARSVVASHWPVPDDYDATKRLVSGLLGATPGEPLGMALEKAQEGLMNDKRTSHPFYWAAFIILGDGAKPLVGAPTMPVADAAKPAKVALR